MEKQPNFVVRLFSFIWRALNTSRKIIINFIFFAFLFVFIIAITADKKEIVVPDNAALVLDISGDVVEQKQLVDPVEVFINDAMDQPPENPEVLLTDITDVIAAAKNDDKIKLIVLNLTKMGNASLTQLRIIGRALNDFKLSNKQVIAVGDQFSQNQYYLASYADEIWMNKQGWLLLDGYGAYPLYFKSALDKLKVSTHIFRVGTYKSAVEPFMRDDMSPAAREANQAWLTELWQTFKEDVAQNRDFDITNFDDKAEQLLEKLAKANGSIAEYALQNHWVDSLKTRNDIEQDLIKLTALDNENKTFTHINFEHYLATLAMDKMLKEARLKNSPKDKVAVIVAKGNILDGKQKPGTIGGDSTAKLLRQARENDKVKAVVLRVDSPGGSAFASEIIRQEVELLKAAGKPVIASMGTYAASGGYWISASADAIIAEPTTITGSIGIFGLMMTFENTLDTLGIHADGVGTTELAGFSPVRAMTPAMQTLFQMAIERGYQEFIQLVAQNRHMTLEQVDQIAQGRVWTGKKAQTLGLVDELGNLHDAIVLAAEKANLTEYDTLLIEQQPSSKDKLLQTLFSDVNVLMDTTERQTALDFVKVKTPLKYQLMHLMQQQGQQLNDFNDPQGLYSLCLPCQAM
jgi:protease-4